MLIPTSNAAGLSKLDAFSVLDPLLVVALLHLVFPVLGAHMHDILCPDGGPYTEDR